MDGVHVLRKRTNTRLWYRQLPVQSQRIINPLGRAVPANVDNSNDAAWEQLFEDLLAEETAAADLTMMAQQTTQLAEVSPEPVAPVARPAAESSVALMPTAVATVTADVVDEFRDDWRIVPRVAPSILLSATNLLDARDPGPVLRPGVRYRIVGMEDSLVHLYVIDPDGEPGDTGFGYCSAVDMICIDRRFADYQPGRSVEFGAPVRSRVTRLTGSLNLARTSFLGAGTRA